MINICIRIRIEFDAPCRNFRRLYTWWIIFKKKFSYRCRFYVSMFPIERLLIKIRHIIKLKLSPPPLHLLNFDVLTFENNPKITEKLETKQVQISWTYSRYFEPNKTNKIIRKKVNSEIDVFRSGTNFNCC